MDPEQRAAVLAEREAEKKHDALKTKHMARLGAAGGIKKVGRGRGGRGGRGRGAVKAPVRTASEYDTEFVVDPVAPPDPDDD